MDLIELSIKVALADLASQGGLAPFATFTRRIASDATDLFASPCVPLSAVSDAARSKLTIAARSGLIRS